MAFRSHKVTPVKVDNYVTSVFPAVLGGICLCNLIKFNNRHFFGNNILRAYSAVNMFNKYLTST